MGTLGASFLMYDVCYSHIVTRVIATVWLKTKMIHLSAVGCKIETRGQQIDVRKVVRTVH